MADEVPGRPEGVDSDRILQSKSRAGVSGSPEGLSPGGSAPGHHVMRLRRPSSLEEMPAHQMCVPQGSTPNPYLLPKTCTRDVSKQLGTMKYSFASR